MDLQDATSKYLAQLAANGRARDTHDQHARHLSLLDRWLAATHRPRALADLTPDVLAAFLISDAARLRPDGEPKRATSMNCLRSTLRCFTAYCHDAGLTAADAGRLVRRARCSAGPPRAPGVRDVQRLLATIDKAAGAAARRDRMLVSFLAATGSRLSAALHVRRGDVDLPRGEVVLNRTKNSSPYVVPLTRALARELAAYLRGLDGDLLFAGHAGHPLGRRQAARRLDEWLRVAGLAGRFSAHGLRHYRALTAYAACHDLLAVKELLGHRSVTSTCTYARLDQLRLRAALGARR